MIMQKIAVFGGVLMLAVVTMSTPRAFAISGGNPFAGDDTNIATTSDGKGNIGKGADIITRFDRAFSVVDSLIFGEQPRLKLETDGLMEGFASGDSTTISPQLDNALIRNTEAKLREGDAKTGLQLTGQTYYRLSDNGGYEDETGEGHYRAKFQAELRWYLLQSSLFGKDGRRQVAYLEEKIARAGYEKERIDINDFLLKSYITQHYDSLMAGVLAYRVNMLRLIGDAQSYLLGNENISSDRRVKNLNERMEAERKLSEIEGTYPMASTLAGIDVTTVRIDSAALVSHVASAQGDMKILELRMQLLEQRERNEKWWADLNVAPFIRYAYYFRSGLPDSYNLDAGVTFTIPINELSGHRKRTLRTERGVVEAEMERLSHRIADKTALVVAETSRLDRATRSELRRLGELKGYLADRTAAYRNVKGEYNRLARAEEYTMYISCLEQLIDYQRRRDSLVADLQALLPDESIMRFCTFSRIKGGDDYQHHDNTLPSK